MIEEYMPACNTCKYAVARDGDSDFLECHHDPIQFVGLDQDGLVVCCFPITEPSEWCGKYVEKPWHPDSVRGVLPKEVWYED